MAGNGGVLGLLPGEGRTAVGGRICHAARSLGTGKEGRGWAEDSLPVVVDERAYFVGSHCIIIGGRISVAPPPPANFSIGTMLSVAIAPRHWLWRIFMFFLHKGGKEKNKK